MTAQRLRLHAIVDGLIKLNGISTQEAAVRAGISPGAVASLRTRNPTQVETWSRMVSALGCTLVIENQANAWTVDVTRPSPPLIDRAWRAWRQRRMVSALHTIGDRRLKRRERDEKARQYVSNEEGRLRERLSERKTHIRQLTGQHRAASLRQAIRLLADKLVLKAEELALLSGVNLGAAQVALGEDGDGRLVTIHRLLSAMHGRLRIELGSRGAVDIAACAPGTWRLGDREEDEHTTERHTKVVAERIGNRSTLDTDRILKLYDADMSIGDIARQAGISRQRVHKIAMDHGRTPRRVAAKERRISEGMEMLG